MILRSTANNKAGDPVKHSTSVLSHSCTLTFSSRIDNDLLNLSSDHIPLEITLIFPKRVEWTSEEPIWSQSDALHCWIKESGSIWDWFLL